MNGRCRAASVPVCLVLCLFFGSLSEAATHWARTIGGSGWEGITSIQRTADGGYVLAGGTSSFGAGGTDFWCVKLDASGNVIWQKTYGGSETDQAIAVQATADGGYILAGNTDSFGAGDMDVWYVKLDASGNVLWQKTYGGGKV